VIELDLSPADLSRIRFAFSPVWETVTSLRTLAGSAANGLHGPWLRDVRPRLAALDLEVLTSLVPASGYIPDFLTPAPTRRSSSFESGLRDVAATPVAQVAAELEISYAADPSPALKALLASPAEGLRTIVADLARYWEVAVEPYWSRVRALLQADLAYRMEELASGGVDQLFRTLHPLVGLKHDTLLITKAYCGQTALNGRGLLLVPCVFAWPDVLVVTAPPHQPTVTYSPRGIGRLWETTPATSESPLADLLGRSRAAIVAQLDLPMTTTQLACQLNLTAPTLSVHLKTLHASGVVSSRRDGRTVLYRRTELGDHLLTGGQRPT
jgi:DNA-binding transcriptional ArsR family regulator